MLTAGACNDKDVTRNLLQRPNPFSDVTIQLRFLALTAGACGKVHQIENQLKELITSKTVTLYRQSRADMFARHTNMQCRTLDLSEC